MSGQNSNSVRRSHATALAFGLLASLLVLPAAVGAPVTRPARPARPPTAGAAPSAGASAGAGDLAGAKTVELTGQEPWTYKPAALPAVPKFAAAAVTLTGGTREFFEKPEGVLVTALPVAKAAVVLVDAPPSKPARVQVERVDLAAGRSLGAAAEVPADTRPVALSPDGTRVLVRAHALGQAGKNDRVEVWTLEPAPAKQLAAWKPQPDSEPWNSRDVAWAAFVDNDHVLTWSTGQQLTLWELPKVRAVYTLKTDFITQPTLSPDRKVVLLQAKNHLALMDALTGAPAGGLPLEAQIHSRNAFRPDGKQLANATANRLMFWDLGPGEAKAAGDFALPPKLNPQRIEWVGDPAAGYGYLLVNGNYLFDVKLGIVLWEYKAMGAAPPSATLGGKFLYAESSRGAKKSYALVSATLPDDPAKKAAAALDPKQVQAVYPGAKVSLEVNLGGEPEDVRKTVTDALTARLKANGVAVADGQPVKLTATETTGQTREISYQMFGQPGSTKASYTEKKLSLAFTADGQTAWEAGGVIGPPFFITLKKGQTISEAIAQHQAQGYNFFKNAELPHMVPKPREPMALGQSELTPTGVSPGGAKPAGARPAGRGR
jgi:hypothetical protein